MMLLKGLNLLLILIGLSLVAIVKSDDKTETEFIPLAPRPENSRICCEKIPYNITEEFTYVKYMSVPYTAYRVEAFTIDNCPGPNYPFSHTEADCQMTRKTSYENYRHVTNAFKRTVVQQKFCREEDKTCCSGYVEDPSGDCLTQDEYDFYESIGLFNYA